MNLAKMREIQWCFCMAWVKVAGLDPWRESLLERLKASSLVPRLNVAERMHGRGRRHRTRALRLRIVLRLHGPCVGRTAGKGLGVLQGGTGHVLCSRGRPDKPRAPVRNAIRFC